MTDNLTIVSHAFHSAFVEITFSRCDVTAEIFELPRDGVVPPCTVRCSSYWKGTLRVTLANFTYFVNCSTNFKSLSLKVDMAPPCLNIHALFFICLHAKANVSNCLLQAIQHGFSLFIPKFFCKSLKIKIKHLNRQSSTSINQVIEYIFMSRWTFLFIQIAKSVH